MLLIGLVPKKISVTGCGVPTGMSGIVLPYFFQASVLTRLSAIVILSLDGDFAA